MTGFNKLL